MGKIVRQFVAENAINGPRSMTGTWLRVGNEQTHTHTHRESCLIMHVYANYP